jgi:serine/threonine protein kinase
MSGMGSDLVGRVVLSRYRIVRPLAEGGMGVVYLGRVEGAAGFARPVVIKTVVPHLRHDSQMAEMLVKEARILSHLRHPSIVGVVDFGQVNDAYMMVLEYVHGFHLGQWSRFLGLSDRLMELDHALHIGTKVLEALHYAHQLRLPNGVELGIVHRDVSLANILIDVCGQVMLHDFGIARTAERNQEHSTQTGSFRGTLSFAAPEVFCGAPATPQSDLYSCAVVIYQIITGVNPFRGRHDSETLLRILHEMPPPPSTLRNGLPSSIDLALTRALSKDPRDRFPTAAAFADALRAARAHSEDEAAQDFARVVARDFLGDMPDRLGLECLSVRDQAWREAQNGPLEPGALSSSRPPNPSYRHSNPEAATAVYGSPKRTGAQDRVIPAQPARRRARGWMVGIALLGAALVSAAGWAALRPSPAVPSPSVIVIEKQPVMERIALAASPTLPASASPSTVPASGPTAGVGQSSATSPPHGARSSPVDAATAYSRAFQQQQQASVERCFTQFATDIQGQPRILVRFTVSQEGMVDHVQVSPASLAKTELGACIVARARKTRFGVQPERVVFTVPITASVSR